MTRQKRPELAFLDEMKAIAAIDSQLTCADRRVKSPRGQDFSVLAKFVPELRV